MVGRVVVGTSDVGLQVWKYGVREAVVGLSVGGVSYVAFKVVGSFVVGIRDVGLHV